MTTYDDQIVIKAGLGCLGLGLGAFAGFVFIIATAIKWVIS